MDAFRRARALMPSAASAFFLGYVCADEGRPKEAIGFFRESLRLNEEDEDRYVDRADAHEALGRVYEALGRNDRAVDSFLRALSLRQDSPVASVNLARLLNQGGAPGEARDLLERLVARYPRMDAAWCNLGVSRAMTGEPGAARAAFKAALRINPRNSEARQNLRVLSQWKALGMLEVRRNPPRQGG
jgi:Tfp pilus assembly protein PilF